MQYIEHIFQHVIRVMLIVVIGALAKKWLFWFCRRVGWSFGLLAIQLQYGLYGFSHLSKWFVFVLVHKFWSVCSLVNGLPTIGYTVLRLGVVADF